MSCARDPLRRLARHPQLPVGSSNHRTHQRAAERNSSPHGAGLVRAQSQDQDLIRGRHKHLALKNHAIHAVPGPCTSLIEVQFPAIACDCSAMLQISAQFTQRLKRLRKASLHLVADLIGEMVIRVL